MSAAADVRLRLSVRVAWWVRPAIVALQCALAAHVIRPHSAYSGCNWITKHGCTPRLAS